MRSTPGCSVMWGFCVRGSFVIDFHVDQTEMADLEALALDEVVRARPEECYDIEENGLGEFHIGQWIAK